MYSVRSAYTISFSTIVGGREKIDGDRLNTSSDGVWKLIWKLEVPPKVRVFWWRVVHEFLPARQVLLMECTVAKEFWRQMKMTTGAASGHICARDLLTHICSRRDRAIIICGIYVGALDGEKQTKTSMTIWQASSWVRDTAFDLWQNMHPAKYEDDAGVEVRWRPPALGWVKRQV